MEEKTNRIFGDFLIFHNFYDNFKRFYNYGLILYKQNSKWRKVLKQQKDFYDKILKSHGIDHNSLLLQDKKN